MTAMDRTTQFLFLLSVSAYAWASDDWTKTDTQVRRGNNLQVVCNGTAPSGAIDLARKEALQGCRNAAISHLQTNLSVKSLVIETERDVALHSETKQHSSYTGLDCKQDKEKIQEDKDNGTVTVFLRCKFDLTKAKVAAIDEPEANDDDTPSSLVKNKEDVTAIPISKESKPKEDLEQSENRHLTLSVVPSPCDSILVRGRPRVIKCDTNPKTVLIFPEDKEIIIRRRGYKSKHIFLNQDRKPTGYEPIEPLEVYLEKI